MPKQDHSSVKTYVPNIKERCASARKALANLSINVTEDVSVDDPTVLDERILDAALDASAMGHMERASALAACAFTKLTPDRMRAVLKHKEEEKARFREEGPRPRFVYHCQMCTFSSEREHVYQTHVDKHVEYHCELCPAFYNHEWELWKHTQESHVDSEENDYYAATRCPFCGHWQNTARRLERHVRHLHLKTVCCAQCDFRCNSPFNMVWHTERVHCRRPFPPVPVTGPCKWRSQCPGGTQHQGTLRI